jgi:hypothetical protein
MAPKSRTPRIARQLRRRAGIPKNMISATTAPPPTVKSLSRGCPRAPLLEVVVTVRVALAADVPETLTELGTEQATPVEALETVQAKLTVPVNPLGVTEIVVVPELPAVTVSELGLEESAKVGAVIATVIVVVSVIGPEALVSEPVTVTV